MFTRLSSLAALALVVASSFAQETLPPGAKVTRLEVSPAAVELKNPFAYNQLLVTGVLADGDRVDVTRLVKIDAPAVVKLAPTGVVRPVADGTGTLKLTLGDQSATVPVKVSGQKDKYPVSFVRDVMPDMTKLGCNAGTCHGAQSGKNGFKLSLRGYDPLFDHRALTDDLEGRRFNRAAPEQSLMLLKPAGLVPHTGGAVMKPGEPAYELLKMWIAEGARFDPESPRVKSIEVFPKNPVVPLPGMKLQTAVLATYTDGTVRDVTLEAFVEPSLQEIATIDKHGLVTTLRRGELALMARFEGAYAATTLVVMGDRSGFVWNPVPENNFIDGLVYEKLRQVKVLPSDLCSDGEFIRRLYIDLTGLLPPTDEVRKFIDDTRPTKIKREELIDKLIGNPDFVEHWTNKWADLLQVNRKFLGPQGAAVLRQFIRDNIDKNTPYDKFVKTILTASGPNLDNPPAAYFKVLRNAPDLMENTTQLFLAVRFNCNKCHDHPFERWTQDQYYHLAAYFAQVSRANDPRSGGQILGRSDVEPAGKPLYEIISDAKSGEINHDRTGAITPPKFPYDHKDVAPATATRREQLAHWVTSKENVYFAKSYVNRIWSYLLGVGLIEPVDDLRAGNPPSNPKLLDRLTDEFIKSGFDTRALMKTICKSRTYQHGLATNKWNQDDEVNFSHALARRLPAEVLYDAIHRATGSVARLPNLPPGARAAQLLDSNDELPGRFLEIFGKPARESACECERSGGMMMGPVLNLVNGPVVGDALKDSANRINKLAEEIKDDAKLIEELYLAFVARKPTAAEVKNLRENALGDAQVAEHARLTAEINERKKQLEADLAARNSAFVAYEKQVNQRMVEWEKLAKAPTPWTVLEFNDLKTREKATLTKQPDGSILVSGNNPGTDLYTLTALTQLKGITGIRLEVLPDAKLPAMGPGRAANGNFVLGEFRVTTSPNQAGARPTPAPLHRPQSTFSQDGLPIQNVIDNNPATGWAIAPRFGQATTAIFEFRTPVGDGKDTKLTITLDHRFGTQHVIGKFRIAVTTAKAPLSLIGPPENIVKLLNIEPAKRTPQQQQELVNFYRATDPEITRLQREASAAQAALAALGTVPTQRQLGAQDIAWALINSKEFLFNH